MCITICWTLFAIRMYLPWLSSSHPCNEGGQLLQYPTCIFPLPLQLVVGSVRMEGH